MKMNEKINAWKNPAQLATDNPAGMIELTGTDLELVAGGGGKCGKKGKSSKSSKSSKGCGKSSKGSGKSSKGSRSGRGSRSGSGGGGCY